MDWSNLEYFLAVAKEGSLSSAAKVLKVNHSTVARRIDKLETDLNVRLFRRHNKGYLLTEHGLALEQETKKVDQQIYQIQRVFKDKETELSGKLVISKPSSGGINITPLISKFIKQYPKIQLDILVAHNSDDVDNLDSDAVAKKALEMYLDSKNKSGLFKPDAANPIYSSIPQYKKVNE